MKEGDVALAVMPQFDQRAKSRPVIVLRGMPSHRDVLVCGVSTRFHQRIENFDEVISLADPDFRSSGLLSESLIRLGFLAILPRGRIAGSIGAVSPERHRRLLRALSGYLIAA
ncbi:MAG TPA: type II toxin-antitoxin system PemK/MazF family toxin [Thermoanaerobaculia bacterium]|nr:type II toxin-antitoxin system PemK/MazF family toxin [Thermoanaerobaculia bacterium]